MYLEALRCLKCIRKVFKMLEHSLKSSSCPIFVGFFTLCYRRCSKIWTIVACQKDQDRAAPDLSTSEEAVWSGSSLFDFRPSMLWIPALITNILFENTDVREFRTFIVGHLKIGRSVFPAKKDLDKQVRPRSDCFWRSSLIRVFPVCYSDKHFVNSRNMVTLRKEEQKRPRQTGQAFCEFQKYGTIRRSTDRLFSSIESH